MNPSERTLWKLEFTAPPSLRGTLVDDLDSLTGGGTCIPALGVWRNPMSGALYEEPVDYWITTSPLKSAIHDVVAKVQKRLAQPGEKAAWHCVTKSEGGISILPV